jgi:uridine kinase
MNPMLIIGIAGGTGCGKTTVVQQMVEALSNDQVSVLSQDNYYKDLSHLDFESRCATNFDHPNAIDFELLKAHLKELKSGRPIKQPVYSFEQHNRTQDYVDVLPTSVVIVEGILVLSDPELRALYDIRIYVEADADERLIRRLKRDVQQRGRDTQEVLERYQTTLKPMHEAFIEPCKAHCDLIIPNNHYNTVAIDVVKAVIHQKLQS